MTEATLHDVLHQAMHRLFALRGVLDPAQAAPGLGATLSEALALHQLASGGALTQAEIAGLLSLDKSTVSRLIDSLQSKGWVERKRDPDDRRFFRIELTAAGQDAAAAVATATRRRHVQVLADLSENERAALVVGLPALVRALARSVA